MAFEPTSKGNKHQLTKDQHFHMKAILRRFANEAGKVKVTIKPFGTVSYLGVSNQRFLGKRAWSEETEKGVSKRIEDAFLREVGRVEAGKPIENHAAISEYHLLWVLRYGYALNPLDEQEILPGLESHMDIELEEAVEAMHKMPVRNGGKIAGRFAATLEIKDLLNNAENRAIYEGMRWNVVLSENKRFISADHYDRYLLVVVNPFLLLQAFSQEKPPYTASAIEVDAYNTFSQAQALHFVFG